MWLCRKCLALFNNPLHSCKKIGQAEQTKTNIHSHFKDMSLYGLVINQTPHCIQYQMLNNVIQAVKSHVNQSCICITVSFMLRQTLEQADKATRVYRDEKQWEVGLRQGLRSAECHARLRRLQPSTHRPKPGFCIGKSNTLLSTALRMLNHRILSSYWYIVQILVIIIAARLVKYTDN